MPNISGTAADPSYSFQGDTTTGMYRIGAGTVGITTGGVERARISSSGLQVGNTSSDGIIRDIRHGLVPSGSASGTVSFANGPMQSIPTVVARVQTNALGYLFSIHVYNVTTSGFSFQRHLLQFNTVNGTYVAAGGAAQDFNYIAISK